MCNTITLTYKAYHNRIYYNVIDYNHIFTAKYLRDFWAKVACDSVSVGTGLMGT